MHLEQQKAFEAFEFTEEEKQREIIRLEIDHANNVLEKILKDTNENRVIITNFERRKKYLGVNYKLF